MRASNYAEKIGAFSSVQEEHTALRLVKSPELAKQSKNSALDGIRAFAIAGVIAYHFKLFDQPYRYPGGIFGVDIFFVLSGFLITGMLVREWKRSKSIDILRFYARRFWRLYPALLVMLVVILAAHTIRKGDFFRSIEEIFIGLSGFANWLKIVPRVRGLHLNHLWSLAIEIQFCLLWPLLCFISLRYGKRVKYLGYSCLLLFLGVSAWRMYMVSSTTDIRRIYLGTDLRLDAFAAGGLSYLLLNEAIGRWEALASAIRRNAVSLVLFGIALHVWLVFAFNDMGRHVFSYYASTTVTFSAVALILGIAASPTGLISRIFSMKPFPQIGRCSYGIYLWHYPFINLFGASFTRTTIGTTVSLALAFLLANVSYHFLEKRR